MVYLLVYCLIGGVVDCSYQCTIELITEAETYSLYMREHSPHRCGCHTDKVLTHFSRVETHSIMRLSIATENTDLNCYRDMTLSSCRDVALEM